MIVHSCVRCGKFSWNGRQLTTVEMVHLKALYDDKEINQVLRIVFMEHGCHKCTNEIGVEAIAKLFNSKRKG